MARRVGSPSAKNTALRRSQTDEAADTGRDVHSMPIGYALPVLLSAIATALAYVPFRSTQRLGRVSYMPTVLLTEVPLLPAYLLAISTTSPSTMVTSAHQPGGRLWSWPRQRSSRSFFCWCRGQVHDQWWKPLCAVRNSPTREVHIALGSDAVPALLPPTP